MNVTVLGAAAALRTREIRLRMRIDSLLAQRAAKERRILELESYLRMEGAEERVELLERRCNHLNRRIIELNEELREERARVA